MKAAVLYKPGDVKIVDWKKPAPKIGEVLIKITACGVCGTDWALYKGEFPATYPVVIGHEFSGTIVEIGEGVKTLKVGDRVSVDPNFVCHKCDYCRTGNIHLCENRQSLGVDIDGADAEYVAHPETNVYKIPDSLSFEEAAFTEPLACALNGMRLANVKLGDTVLILGAGGMGNLITQCCAHAGAANIIVSEPIKMRRQKALENGATHVIDPSKQDVDSELRKIKRIGADVVFECAGVNPLQASAVEHVRKGGTVEWFGCSPQDKTIQVNPFVINDREIKITGSFNNPYATGRAIQLLASKAVRVDNLISHKIPLENYLDVFKIFGGPDTLKLMVVVQ